MRKKKRYLRFTEYPRELPEDAEFLFQDRQGYVFRAPLDSAEKLRGQAVLISGSMKKLKGYSGPKPK